MKLHDKQIRLLKLLGNNVDSPMTIRELMEELDLSSPSLVHHHITQLEKKGYLKRDPSNSSNYQVLQSPEAPVSFVNLYGLAKCGPEGTLLSGDVMDRIPLSSRIISFKTDQAFMVEATGDSMEPEIKEGDLVICQKKKNAYNGNIIICTHDGNAMIKKYRELSPDQILLESLNTKYSPILITKDSEFHIEGLYRGLIRS